MKSDALKKCIFNDHINIRCKIIRFRNLTMYNSLSISKYVLGFL